MTQWLSLNAAERHLSGDTLRKKSSSDSRHGFSSLGSARAVFLRERDLTWHRYTHAADVSYHCWLRAMRLWMFSDYRLLANRLLAFSFVYLSTIICTRDRSFVQVLCLGDTRAGWRFIRQCVFALQNNRVAVRGAGDGRNHRASPKDVAVWLWGRVQLPGHDTASGQHWAHALHQWRQAARRRIRYSTTR